MMLKTLDKVAHRIEVEVQEGLFSGPRDPLQILAEKLAEKILAEPGLPLEGIRVARGDLPLEDGQVDEGPEIGFYLNLACGRREAFEWLERLSHRQLEIDRSLPAKDRKLFNHTFRIVPLCKRER